VCQYLQNNLNKNGVQTPRTKVIYTGIDINHYTPDAYDGSKTGKVMLQVGAFNDKKGHLITLNSFRRFLDTTGRNDVTIRFVGDGKNLQECIQRTIDLKIENKVFFLGRLGKSEIKKELKNASVFLHHSITGPNGDQEGIPNAVAEAMAMNLPVISTVHAGIPELVLPQADGILIEEGDVAAYADAMENIIDQPRSTINRNLVLDQFSLNEHITEFLSYYSQIAGI
jgi:colanic acid/amylovoran biosynthesis glycosyltransferase